MSSQTPYTDIARNGVWTQNSILAQLLGLCPLLAVSSTFVNAFSPEKSRRVCANGIYLTKQY